MLRDSYIYALLLQDGFHPDFLRDGLDRDRLVDRLWAGLKYFPSVQAERAIPHERDDLLVGDIPYFYTETDSTDLWDSEDRIVPNFFETSALSAVLERCRSLSVQDCEKQKGLMAPLLDPEGMVVEGGRIVASRRSEWADGRPEDEGPVSSDEFLHAAVEIGDRLEQTAVWGARRHDATWLGITATGIDQWEYSPADRGLYNGLPGIALFLAYLAEVSGEVRFRRLAKAAMRSLDRMLDEDPSPPSISAFQGQTSSVYALMHLSSLWGDRGLLDVAVARAESLLDRVPSDSEFDLLNGAAGALVVHLHLHRLSGCVEPLEVAVACGDHLLNNALKMEAGHGWKISSADDPLSGFSHGAAGIAWSLALLANATGEERFEDMALSAFEYERSLYDPEHGNWRDLRMQSDNGYAFSMSWCHGAPGIGISRLLCSDLMAHQHAEEEIRSALEATRERGFGYSHCLCHGDFGNLEVFLLAAEKLRAPSYLREAYLRGATALKVARQRRRWSSGWSSGDETPGLMVGLAGIGFGLLRLAAPEVVPSIVHLSPPKEDAAGPDEPRATS